MKALTILMRAGQEDTNRYTYYMMLNTVFVSWLGKPNIISVWAENSVGLVSKARTGTVVIDKTAPKAGTVRCPAFIQVCISVLNM